MTDESEEACLVNPKSPTQASTHGGMPYTDGLHTTDSNRGHPSSRQSHAASRQSQGTDDAYDINDDIILSQFHADAIKQVRSKLLTPRFLPIVKRHNFWFQAGFGKFQCVASLIVGLGLAGHVIQVYSIFYILPSAEVEYCILDDEKNWVGNITLIGIGCGALLWGALAGRNGRRRALLSCLAVSGVFSGNIFRFTRKILFCHADSSISDCRLHAHLWTVHDVPILCSDRHRRCIPIGCMVNELSIWHRFL